MTKMNINKGDIGETDEENDKLIEKMEMRSARKAKKPVLHSVTVLNTPDSLVSYTESAAKVEEETIKAASANAEATAKEANSTTVAPIAEEKVEVVLDGNLEVVTDNQIKADLLEAEAKKQAPKAEKKEKVKAERKEQAPKYLSKDVNPNKHTLLSPELVIKIFQSKAEGMKNPQIAEKYNLSVGTVSTVLSGPQWLRDRMTKYGQKSDANWQYPKRAEKPTEK